MKALPVKLSYANVISTLALILAVGGGTAYAQDHTIIALSHTNHTVYEVDPATGKVLHEFVAPDQPHEAAISADGSTIFAMVGTGASAATTTTGSPHAGSRK